MICCCCGSKFKYSQIPIVERIYTKWCAIVACPDCGKLLKPKKEKIVALNLSVSLFSIMIFLFLFDISKLLPASKLVYLLLAATAIAAFITSIAIEKTDVASL